MEYLSLTNKPPRTSPEKTLRFYSNNALGNLAVSLVGGWSEYSPEDVEQIVQAAEMWLSDLQKWVCPKCGEFNRTTPASEWEYQWVKCRHCNKKTDRSKVDFS